MSFVYGDMRYINKFDEFMNSSIKENFHHGSITEKTKKISEDDHKGEFEQRLEGSLGERRITERKSANEVRSMLKEEIERIIRSARISAAETRQFERKEGIVKPEVSGTKYHKEMSQELESAFKSLEEKIDQIKINEFGYKEIKLFIKQMKNQFGSSSTIEES